MRIPRWLPWIVLLTGLLISALTWNWIREQERLRIREASETFLVSIDSLANTVLERKHKSISRMTSRWEARHYESATKWELDALGYLEDYPSLDAILIVNKNLEVVRSVRRPQDTTEVNHDMYFQSLMPFFDLAQDTGQIQMSPAVHVNQRKSVLFYISPIQDRGPHPFLVFQFNLEDFFEQVWRNLAAGFDYMILENGEVIFAEPSYLKNIEPEDRSYWLETQIRVPNRTWKVLASPNHIKLKHLRSSTPMIVLLIGISFSLLMGMVLFFVRKIQNQLAEKREIEEALRKAHRQKDEFLAIVSHELRSPLNVILGYCDLLPTLPPQSKEFNESVRRIQAAAEQQTGLVSDLLDISRMVSGKMRLEAKHCRISDVVRNALDSVTFTTNAKGITIQSSIKTSAQYLVCDPDRLQQILWNLLSNAVKFTERGGRIDIEVTQDKDRIHFQVRDTGRGIEPKQIHQIFNRFWQEDTSVTRQKGGLGLGLSIVKNLVEMHGGQIAAHSEGVGKGATFRFWIPVLAVQPEAQRPVSLQKKVTESRAEGTLPVHANLENLEILLVEDQEDSRLVMERLLKKYGAHVHSAENGLSALETYQQQPVDLIISDISMPEMDGYTLIQKIREQEKNKVDGITPAIALTAFGSQEDKVRALSLGFQTHLTKPVSRDVLLQSIFQLTHKPGRPPAEHSSPTSVLSQ